MPSYAILGSTGNTGQAILEVLLQSPQNEVHAYCRSKAKLARTCPASAENKRVSVFEGQLDDVELVANCIRGTRAVFLAVAIIDNMPGCTIAQETAQHVVAAMERLRAEKASLPKLIVLSSASLDESMSADTPPVVHSVLSTAVSYLYDDLEKAEIYLRARGDWISTIFMKPGGLVKDKQGGHRLSLHNAKTPLSFLDLAAGMIEVADSQDNQYDMKNVSVLPTASHVAFPWEGVYFVFTGLCYHFMPWTYRFMGEYPLPKSKA